MGKKTIKLNAAGISLFVRPEKESRRETKLSALGFLFAAQFEKASGKPEYLEIHYDLCEWSCKLDMGPLESALVPFVLVSWCWLGYFFIDLCCECFIAFGRIRIVTSSFTLPRPLYATIRNQLLGLQGSQNMPAGERRLTESPWFGQTKDLHGAEGAAYLHAD